MSRFDSHFGRFFQLGYVTRDIDAAVDVLERRMAAKRMDLTYDLRDADGQPFELANLSHLSLPGVEIEIIQPRLDRPSIYLEALPDDPADVALHHLGFILPNRAAWDAAIARLDPSETPIAWRIGNAAAEVVYIDTRKATGHYSELVVREETAGTRPLPS